MIPWWQKWLKWWVWAAAVSLIIIILSEPPQLWFWITIFVALVFYGLERTFNS